MHPHNTADQCTSARKVHSYLLSFAAIQWDPCFRPRLRGIRVTQRLSRLHYEKALLLLLFFQKRPGAENVVQ